MHAFNYHRPSSLADASGLAGKGADAKLLAGGQSLVQAMKLRLSAPSDLVDLNQIAELRGIKSDGKTVTVGAMARHAEVAASAEVKKAITEGHGKMKPVKIDNAEAVAEYVAGLKK